MIRLLLSAAIVMGMGSAAIAGELDDEKGSTNTQIQGTMVLRVDTRNNSASFVKTEAVMTSKSQAENFAKSADFAPVPASKMKSELDNDGGASSWYFYYPYNNYSYNPYCNWYGNGYQPYYNYGYGYYNYYYYSSCYWSGCGGYYR